MAYFKSLIATFILSSLMFTDCSGQSEQVSNIETNSSEQSRILVFSKTDGWRHQSIEAGQQAIEDLGEKNNVSVRVTENAEIFNSDSLAGFDAVVFLNTTQTIFTDEQREAFKSYIQSGGGYVGIHSASDTEYEWPWYGELVGAYFENHPSGTPNADILVQDGDHMAAEMLPGVWNRNDEWYNYQGFSDHINVLLTLDTSSYEGSEHPGNHPIAWYHEYDGGRSFYTGLGHTNKSFTEDDLFLAHLWGGIQYAMGQ